MVHHFRGRMRSLLSMLDVTGNQMCHDLEHGDDTILSLSEIGCSSNENGLCLSAIAVFPA